MCYAIYVSIDSYSNKRINTLLRRSNLNKLASVQPSPWGMNWVGGAMPLGLEKTGSQRNGDKEKRRAEYKPWACLEEDAELFPASWL